MTLNLQFFYTFVVLKKVLAILLVTVHLLTTTELSELMKMPLLVQHYIEHRANDEAVTLMDFLAMHYAHGDVKDADYDKDKRLPFKSHEGCINLSILICIPQLTQSVMEEPHAIRSEKIVLPEITFLSSAFLSSIWQPPKSC